MTINHAFALAGVSLSLFLIAYLLISPTERRRSRGRREARDRRAEDQPRKDWQAACLKLEKHIHSLRDEILALQRKNKGLERDIFIQKEKAGKVKEKLAQERGWQSKEKQDTEKKTARLQQVKKDLQAAEENLGREHGERLRLERQLEEVRRELKDSRQSGEALTAEVARLKALGDGNRREILHLRQENARLARQHDDTTWIAKSEFVKIENELKAARNELEALKKPGGGAPGKE